MGVADLRSAFNAVAEPAYSCQRATLRYEPGDGIQFQIIEFYGSSAGGVPFSVKSDRLRPNADVNQAAAILAQSLLDRGDSP